MKNKYIAFSFMAILAVTLVSAGLVNYLSDTVETDINVESPILIGAFTGDVAALGGETKTISTTLVNQADAIIKGKLKLVITNTGITLGDFNTLTANINETRPGFTPELNVMTDLDIMTTAGFIESIEEGVADELTFISGERTFEIGETWDADIELGFKSNVKGNYNVAVTIIPLA